MVLRARSVIFVAALCALLNLAQCEGISDDSAADSDDDDSLRQALLLIKLIRKAKVADASREKHALSKQEAIPAPLSPDPPQPLHNVSSFNNTFRADHHYRRSISDADVGRSQISDGRSQNSVARNHIADERSHILDERNLNSVGKSQILDEKRQKLDERSQNSARRIEISNGRNQISDERSQHSVGSQISGGRRQHKEDHRHKFYRRHNNEDKFGTHPTLKSIELATAAAASTLAPTTVTATPPPAAASPVASEASKPKHTTNKLQTDVTAETTGIKKSSDAKFRSLREMQKLSLINTGKSSENSEENIQMITKNRLNTQVKDPIMYQVESELKNEMDTVTGKNQVEKLYKYTNARRDIMKPKAQSTLRVHLEGSSRYPIPYPQNHAICYTNPNNGLCRTPI